MYRSKKEVLASIKSQSCKKNGVEYSVFSAYFGRGPDGRHKRVARSDLDELKLYVSQFYRDLDDGRPQLSCDEAVDARAALDMLTAAGAAIPLVECVRVALRAREAERDAPSVPLGEAYSRWMESVRNRSDSYRKTLRFRVGPWVEEFGAGRPADEVSAAEVKGYLLKNVYRADDVGTMTTYNKVLGDICTFVRWCCSAEQGILKANPLEGMKRMEIPYRQPEYMKAADVDRLFRVLEARSGVAPWDLADAVLSFFCGMRQSEIERVRDGEDAVRVCLEDEEPFIRVAHCKGSSRGVRPRTFRIPEQALAWMMSFDFARGLAEQNPRFRRHLADAACEAGVSLPENAGRHSFITMYEAAHHDAAALSAIVGNTDAVRARSYNGVELGAEGRAYFAILPKSAGGDAPAPRD